MAKLRGRRVRDPGMGRLVQQPTAPGAHRQHPAGRSRATLLRHAGTTRHGGITSTKWPPANPGRSTAPRNATSKPSRSGSTNVVNPGAIRIASPIGEVRLNVDRATGGLARDPSAVNSGGRNSDSKSNPNANANQGGNGNANGNGGGNAAGSSSGPGMAATVGGGNGKGNAYAGANGNGRGNGNGGGRGRN